MRFIACVAEVPFDTAVKILENAGGGSCEAQRVKQWNEI